MNQQSETKNRRQPSFETTNDSVGTLSNSHGNLRVTKSKMNPGNNTGQLSKAKNEKHVVLTKKDSFPQNESFKSVRPKTRKITSNHSRPAKEKQHNFESSMRHKTSYRDLWRSEHNSDNKFDNTHAEHSQGKAKKRWSLNYKRLKELVHKSHNEILFTLCNPNEGLDTILHSGEISKEVMAYVLIAIGRACKSQYKSNVTALINMVVDNKNFMLCSLQQYLASLVTFDVQSHHRESLLETINFFCWLQLYSPASASETITVIFPLFRDVCRSVFKENSSMEETLSKIYADNNSFLEDHTLAQVKTEARYERLHSKFPPESYRCVDVLPDAEDIFSEKPFLRPNLVNGKYVDTNHYLDVQFRLLREDYIRPLREGINEYINQKKAKRKSKIQNIHIYENVRIGKCQLFEGIRIHTIFLDLKTLPKIQWNTCKRFLHGSLVCLSSDNYKTMHFASVLNRDIEKLEKGEIIVKFESFDGIMNFDNSIYFTMIETNAFFEAYRHNLDALQQMEADFFPFQEYILKLEKHVKPPAYLQTSSTYDIMPLLPTFKEHLEDPFDEYFFSSSDDENDYGKKELYDSDEVDHLFMNKEMDLGTVSICIDILDYNEWPPMEQLGLDESQYEALRSAITKEFAIIQGPPGTGKTYIGLKIVKLLLSNSSSWRSDAKSPILIVCYTNHALDQFLEGLLKVTKKIVRIGGRCSNENLKTFQLQNLRHIYRFKRKRTEDYCMHGMKAILNKSTHEIQKQMTMIHKNIVNCDEYLMNETLWEFVVNHHYYELDALADSGNIKSNYFLIRNWLGIKDENVYCNAVINNVPETYETQRMNMNNMNDLHETKHEGCSDTLTDIIEEEEEDIDYMEDIRNVENEDLDLFLKQADLQDEADAHPSSNASEWQLLTGNKITKEILEKLKRTTAMSTEKALGIQFLSTLTLDERWRLYKFWKEEHLKHLTSEYHVLKVKLNQNVNELKEVKNAVDFSILKHAKIVGMTTTGAAKYRDIVVGLNPRIIIVEEAAEVLEAHIITTLAKDTQHLILIGDHQQLRPSTNVYELAVGYNLDLSLFERMVINGVEYCQLKIQHRMRPCISTLIVPHIYPVLENHDSVMDYSNILGVTKNMYFVKHTSPEKQTEGSTTKVNLHEASFIVELCRYLLLQGYPGTKITILTMYAGQMFAIRNMTRGKPLFSGVRITVVDNFQGEENDIILISFVRSNEEGKIGFLKIPNRVCVALSRAKKGFFCIGNFDLLAEKSILWRNIVEGLVKKDAIGSSLRLQCQNHPDILTEVSEESDFVRVPEGGCSKLCDYRLNCGHHCGKECHPNNHHTVKCNNDCERSCISGHRCSFKCYEECKPCKVMIEKQFLQCKHNAQILCYQQDEVCPIPCQKVLECSHECLKICGIPCEPCIKKVSVDLPCGHKMNVKCHESSEKDKLVMKCVVKVEKQLSNCKHKASLPCNMPENEFRCIEPCSKVLKCGHKCSKKCWYPCECKEIIEIKLPCSHEMKVKCSQSNNLKLFASKCTVKVDKSLPNCEHKVHVPCNRSVNNCKCQQPCSRIMTCGHKCIQTCNQKCKCDVQVERILQKCNHKVAIPCSMPESHYICREACKKTLQCGHKCQNMCGAICQKLCMEKVNMELLCGHTNKAPCWMSNCKEELVLKCKEQCNAQLSCGHTCSGTCQKCFQGRIHVYCRKVCERVLVCGHKCQSLCFKNCPPCKKKCSHWCDHGKCYNRCDSPCQVCLEDCSWKCEHFACTNTCGELCNRLPCNEPCDKLLKCGHTCVGLCGEPCLKLCSKCNSQNKIFLDADSEDNKYIILEDCGHIFELEYLKKWLSDDFEKDFHEVKVKTCPLCRSVIRKNSYFGNVIKQCKTNLEKIKYKTCNRGTIILERQLALREELVKFIQLIHYSRNKNTRSTKYYKMRNYQKTLINALRFLSQSLDPRNMMQALEIVRFENALKILKMLFDVIKNLCESAVYTYNEKLKKYEVKSFMFVEKTWEMIELFLIDLPYASKQRLIDIAQEMQRLKLLCKYINFLKIFTPERVYSRNRFGLEIIPKQKLSTELDNYLSALTSSHISEITELLCKQGVFTVNEEQLVKKLFSNACKTIGFTEQSFDYPDNSFTLKCMNLIEGYWYACPNGHVFCQEVDGVKELVCSECGFTSKLQTKTK